MQMEAEESRISRQRREIVTADTFLEKAKETQLSNDDMMKLSDNRVSARSNVIHLSTNKFWQTMTLESGHQLILLAKGKNEKGSHPFHVPNWSGQKMAYI
jgi:hypothetical protein